MDEPSAQYLLAIACNDDLSTMQVVRQVHKCIQDYMQTQIPLLQAVKPADVDCAKFLLLYDNTGVSLLYTGHRVPGAIRAEFTVGQANHRRLFGGGKGQMIAKAVGVKSNLKPCVLDLTAGLGKDGFVLAGLGCTVTLIERSPLIYALLNDGLARAKVYAADNSADLRQILSNITHELSDGKRFLSGLGEDDRPDVIYMDPMFPESSKSASVKKEMRALQELVGKDLYAADLLALSLEKACYRVVVKRPRKAPSLDGQKPTYKIEGKSTRYDIYVLKSLTEKTIFLGKNEKIAQ